MHITSLGIPRGYARNAGTVSRSGGIRCTGSNRYGTEVVPSSVYEVQLFDQAQESCRDRLEGMFSAPLAIPTARWGDVVAPFQAPSPAPLSEPSALDVIWEVSKVGYPPGWPIKVVAQLQGNVPDPNQDVSDLDRSFCADAVSGNAYPFPGPVACPCTDAADIRADLNGDGRIDAADDALEATTALYFVVNSDDDNGNGREDYLDDGPVENEDDLVEVRLLAKCPPLDPATAWWSISWTEPDPPNPALNVWPTPDKSNGSGGAGTPITNGLPYASWPPPASLWLEAVHSYDNIEITLTITDNSVGSGLAVDGTEPTKSTTLTVASPCTPTEANAQNVVYWNRKHMLPNDSIVDDITGVSATINFRPVKLWFFREFRELL